MPRLYELPAGERLFVDANIFLEHLLNSEPTCAAFFQRIQHREIHAVTSVAVLSEARHRLLLTEAIRRGYVSKPDRALAVLQQRPGLLRHLTACDEALNLLLETPLRVVNVTLAQFRLAQRLSLRYGLLTTDALHLATLRAHRLRHLATNDADFATIPRLTLWTL